MQPDPQRQSVRQTGVLPGRPWLAWNACTLSRCSVHRATPGGKKIRLSAAQLLVNQRITQAAITRAAVVEAYLDAGISGDQIQTGSLTPHDFSSGITTSGSPTGAFVAPRDRLTIPISSVQRQNPGTVRLSAAQLLINQRIAQVAIRRINALERRLNDGLSGGDIIDGTISAENLAPGVSITASTSEPPPPASTTDVGAPGPRSGRVTLSQRQLETNQVISQTAVIRINRLIDRIETGLTGADIKDGTITAADLR